jgi:hypothetical protein
MLNPCQSIITIDHTIDVVHEPVALKGRDVPLDQPVRVKHRDESNGNMLTLLADALDERHHHTLPT